MRFLSDGPVRLGRVAVAVGLVLALAGALLPSAAAYLVGVLAGCVGLGLLLWTRRGALVTLGVPAAAAALAIGLPWSLAPRTDGLEGVWSAEALDGAVVAGRALVSPANAALDLRSGASVRLGSVTGGERYLAADSLVIVSPGRLDLATLAGTVRWTWRPTAPTTITPLASDGTVVALRACPRAGGDCRLLGIGTAGRQLWDIADPSDRAAAPSFAGTLPLVAALAPRGTGVVVLDPASGRYVLAPGERAVALPDGRVSVLAESAGECTTLTYAAVDSPETGSAPAPCPASTPAPAAPPRATTQSWRLNPFAPARTVHVIEHGGRRLVSARPLTALVADGHALVVREGDRVIRYETSG
ncbi:MAG: PQQ-like beta-propeller repeat protein [Micrococcales bacterium]|nr:PQQ-like beta-propeller repeat protein [Micrococcales bacterium]